MALRLTLLMLVSMLWGLDACAGQSEENAIHYRITNIEEKDGQYSLIISLTNKYPKAIYFHIYEKTSVFEGCEEADTVDIWKTFLPDSAVGGPSTLHEHRLLPKFVRVDPLRSYSVKISVKYPFSYKHARLPEHIMNPIEVSLESVKLNIIVGVDLPFTEPPAFDKGTMLYDWRYLFETGYLLLDKASKSGVMRMITANYADLNDITMKLGCNLPLSRVGE